jgi:hypothetical protein
MNHILPLFPIRKTIGNDIHYGMKTRITMEIRAAIQAIQNITLFFCQKTISRSSTDSVSFRNFNKHVDRNRQSDFDFSAYDF